MRQSKMRAEKTIVSVVEKLVKTNVNTACFWWSYQPKLPNGCEKLKRQ